MPFQVLSRENAFSAACTLEFGFFCVFLHVYVRQPGRSTLSSSHLHGGGGGGVGDCGIWQRVPEGLLQLKMGRLLVC